MKMNGFVMIGLAVVTAASLGRMAQGEYIDWSDVVLDGNNPYTFTDSTLGDVTITYSGNYSQAGVIYQFSSEPLLGLGETGTGTGTVEIAWANPVTSLNLQMWDLDLGEFNLIFVPDGVNLSLVSDNPHAANDQLIGNMMTGSEFDEPNASNTNYAEVQMSGSAFTEFSVEFQRPGGSSGAHALGIGEAVPVPAPAALGLFGAAIASSGRRRRR